MERETGKKQTLQIKKHLEVTISIKYFSEIQELGQLGGQEAEFTLVVQDPNELAEFAKKCGQHFINIRN